MIAFEIHHREQAELHRELALEHRRAAADRAPDDASDRPPERRRARSRSAAVVALASWFPTTSPVAR